jgi:FkbM family methyltransferase
MSRYVGASLRLHHPHKAPAADRSETRRRSGNSVFVSVNVDNRIIEFAAQRDSNDPIVRALTEGCFPSDATNDLWRHLVQPRHTVIDVGAHVGTYSLPAAATGARVLAVEASPVNASLLELAATRNSFTNIQILRVAAAAETGTVKFTTLGPWGYVAPRSEADGMKEGTAEVTAMALDDAIRAQSWEHVDLIKLDIEGSELEALAGLKRTLDRDEAPLLLVEANGHMLHQFGREPGDLIAALQRYGYACHRIDPGSDRRLVPVSSTDLQPECVADYLAFKTMPESLAPWWVDRPFERADVIRRVAATCQDEQLQHRVYGAKLLAAGPAWLLEDESIRRVRRALEADEHVEIREAVSQLRKS